MRYIKANSLRPLVRMIFPAVRGSLKTLARIALGVFFGSIFLMPNAWVSAGTATAVGNANPEPGLAQDQPTQIAFGQTLAVVIGDDSFHRFIFTARAGDVVSIRLAGTATRLELLDEAGMLLSVNGENPARIDTTLPSSGVFTIIARDVSSGFRGGGFYGLSLQRVNAPALITESLACGESAAEFISNIGERDTYTFRGNTNDRVTIRMAQTDTGDVNPQIELYDPDGQLLEIARDNSQATIENFLLEIRGRYTILAADSSRNTGSYMISIECRPEPLDFVLPVVFTGQATEGVRETEFVFANPLELINRGTIEFFNANGSRLDVTLRGDASISNNAFDFSVPPNGVLRVQTENPTALLRGWAFVATERALRLNIAIRSIDATGNVVFESKYQPPPLSKTFNFFADTVGEDTDTLLYILNPSVDEEARIVLRLFNGDGEVATDFPVVLRPLPPLNQVSVSLLASFPLVAGIDEFEGTIVVESSGDISLLALKKVGTRLIVVPTF